LDGEDSPSDGHGNRAVVGGPAGQASVWAYYDVAHRMNNLKVHTTTLALGQTIKQSPDRVMRFTVSPTMDERELMRPLAAAWWTYMQTVSLVLQETAPEQLEAFNKMISLQHFDFLPLDVQRKHRVGRNDPCPCGSGQKYKKCHGA
jgi:preprotein translocase subunit SecA